LGPFRRDRILVGRKHVMEEVTPQSWGVLVIFTLLSIPSPFRVSLHLDKPIWKVLTPSKVKSF